MAETLPKELIQAILVDLDAIDLWRLGIASKFFASAVQNDALWQRLLAKYIALSEDKNKRIFSQFVAEAPKDFDSIEHEPGLVRLALVPSPTGPKASPKPALTLKLKPKTRVSPPESPNGSPRRGPDSPRIPDLDILADDVDVGDYEPSPKLAVREVPVQSFSVSFRKAMQKRTETLSEAVRRNFMRVMSSEIFHYLYSRSHTFTPPSLMQRRMSCRFTWAERVQWHFFPVRTADLVPPLLVPTPNNGTLQIGLTGPPAPGKNSYPYAASDLVQTARRLLRFLRHMRKNRDDYYWPEMVRRFAVFVELQVDIASKGSKEFLVPTPEIELVWVAALLNPVEYNFKFIEAFPTFPAHSSLYLLSTKDERRPSMAFTAKLWKERTGWDYKKEERAPMKTKTPPPVVLSALLIATQRTGQASTLNWIGKFDEYVKKQKKAGPKAHTLEALPVPSRPATPLPPIDFKDKHSLMARAMREYRHFLWNAATLLGSYQHRSGYYDDRENAHMIERFVSRAVPVESELGEPSYLADWLWHAHMLHPVEYEFD